MLMLKRAVACLSVMSLIGLYGCGGGSTPDATSTGSGTSDAPKPADAPAKPKEKAGAAAAFDKAKATATIKGTVTLVGDAPKMPKINMDATKACSDMHAGTEVHKEDVVSKDGKLANVVVYVKSVDGKAVEDTWTFETPTTEASIDQKGCMYNPHILAVQANQPVAITSSDDLAHNIHYVPGNNREFNESQQKAGSKKVVTFPETDLGANFVCNIHGWMKAYLFVVPHPFFAVSKEDGTYELPKLPAGKYELVIWQESANDSGKLTPVDNVTVELKDGETQTKDFAFKVK